MDSVQRDETRIKNCRYEWSPPHLKYQDLPPSTYKKETRAPKFLVFVEPSDDPQDLAKLYFLNQSSETLEWVSTSLGGFQTVDDDVVSKSSTERVFELVAPGEAVLIGTFDPIGDSDFVFQPQVSLSSPSLGKVEIRGKATKGKYEDSVLLWDTDEPQKDVQITQLDDQDG